VKRPRQHVLGEMGEKLVERLLPSEWIVRKIPKDYGVDFLARFETEGSASQRHARRLSALEGATL
jgi:hypothetical protein